MMITGELKSKIDRIWETFWTGGITNPLEVIEQFTYLLFIKDLDDNETIEESNAELLGIPFEGMFPSDKQHLRWSKFKNEEAGEMYRIVSEEVFPFIKNIHGDKQSAYSKYMGDAMFKIPTPLMLSKIVDAIDNLDMSDKDAKGDLYEYLLSKVATAGTNGQFRTPRHIIDFIVDIVKPTKADTILDPACGTAGFLISAYKFIQKTAQDSNQPLTPKERTTLTENIQGYDISPDMQKLALVNMYLHKFKNPKIYEYDTLTNTKRWEDYFDCILANPPFMTPKGGIQPHNKFGVKANRSEVLFVDYIMEHLNSTGRAGVIVPEGIVFQSANAYKELRKKLVEENYLYAVVSLPSGIFQPYSGVKTSILFMDRQLAKKSDKVLFVEIQNDGFDLGAQRRPIDKNDLPKALEFIHQWQNSINTQTEFAMESKLVTVVEKSKLAENEEYNLTTSRYKVTQDFSNCKWDIIALGDVVDIYNGSTPLKTNDEYWNKEDIPWFTIEDIRKQGRVILSTQKYITQKALDETSVKLLPKDTVLICCTASVGEYALTKIELTTNQQFNGMVVKECYKNKLLPKYLFWMTSTFKDELIRLSGKTSFEFVSVKTLKTIQIPLPPLEVQEEIVSELDGYQAVIDGAQKVIDNWKPTLPINPNWEKTRLGDICEVQSGGTPLKNKKEYWSGGSINWYSSGELNDIYTSESNGKITPLGLKNSNAKLFPKGSLLVGMYDTAAFKMSILDREATFNQAISGIKPNNKINMYFLYLYFTANRDSYMKQRSGVRQQNLNKGFICDIEVPVPSLEEQKDIVSKVENERIIIEECRKLIKLHQEKINTKIQSIWGEERE